MARAETISCKNCSKTFGMLTVHGNLTLTPEGFTSRNVQKSTRPSSLWLEGGTTQSISPVDITALCNRCINVDNVIQLYLEKHYTEHTQSTLLRLIVVAQLLVSDNTSIGENPLDIAVIARGGIVFDYSTHVCRKTTTVPYNKTTVL